MVSIVQSVGQRALLKVKDHQQVEECRILEVSPSGEWVKLHLLNPEDGTPFRNDRLWVPTADVLFVEGLPDSEGS